MTRGNQILFANRPASFPGRARCLAFVMLVLGIFFAGPLRATDQPALPEFQVKAAFLINFPKYVDWPADAFAETNSPVVIAVMGDTKMADELEKGIVGRIINGRTIILKRLAAGEAPGSCHILFITAIEKHAPDILAKLKDAPVLTVGESSDFLDDGGIINLARRDQKIALEVNLSAAGSARIKISSKLLNVAAVVRGRTN